MELAPALVPSADVVGAWDQLIDAIINYRVVGLTGLLALGIGVVIAVLKRWQTHGPGVPNWWERLPRWGKRTVVASLGVIAGVLASIRGGANVGQAILLGFAGILSVVGHELGRKVGLIPPGSAPATDGGDDGDGPAPPAAPATP